MCIVSALENELFKDIKFDTLGLGNFVERFSVSSDSFFDGILIQNFSHLNKAINTRLVETVFTKNGFLIKAAENIKSENTIKPEYKADDCEKLILNVFSDGIFNNFREYCNSNGL